MAYFKVLLAYVDHILCHSFGVCCLVVGVFTVFLCFLSYWKMIAIALLLFVVSVQGARKVGENALLDALNLGQTNLNNTREDCIWRTDNDVCSKNFFKYTLYTKKTSSSEENYTNDEMRSFDVDMSSPVWLHSSDWNPSHETVVLVHGYGGTADHLPTGILRDAYIKNGSYNVIVVDWSPLSRLPCYLSAVHNIKSAAKCIGELFKFLRNSGVDMQRTSCVGHSLGAHVCGVVSNYLNFRMHKIIGLDPAKPLIPNVLKSRLDAGDADQVQVLHTSSSYGDSKKIGHVDFYFNGGRIQPYCVNVTNEELCSHMRSVCYLAESIFADKVRHGTKCKRRNLQGDSDVKGILNRIGNAHFMPVGQPTPEGAVGTYCVSNIEAPFCAIDRKDRGSPYCCRPSAIQTSDVSTADNSIERESKSSKVEFEKKNSKLISNI